MGKDLREEQEEQEVRGRVRVNEVRVKVRGRVRVNEVRVKVRVKERLCGRDGESSPLGGREGGLDEG